MTAARVLAGRSRLPSDNLPKELHRKYFEKKYIKYIERKYKKVYRIEFITSYGYFKKFWVKIFQRNK